MNQSNLLFNHFLGNCFESCHQLRDWWRRIWSNPRDEPWIRSLERMLQWRKRRKERKIEGWFRRGYLRWSGLNWNRDSLSLLFVKCFSKQRWEKKEDKKRVRGQTLGFQNKPMWYNYELSETATYKDVNKNMVVCVIYMNEKKKNLSLKVEKLIITNR